MKNEPIKPESVVLYLLIKKANKMLNEVKKELDQMEHLVVERDAERFRLELDNMREAVHIIDRDLTAWMGDTPGNYETAVS